MMRFSSTIAIVSSGAALLSSVAAQSNGQCISLQGSAQCPSFQNAWINPTNLTSAWPWFASVTNVATFDQQFAQYFTDPTRFVATKFINQLQCTEPAIYNTTLQWERTILCGQFSQISYSAQCNVANAANPVMVCQDTCLQYSGAQRLAVENPQICAANTTLTAAQVTTRNNTLTKDYVDCTDWTSLVSTTNNTCVEGITNEGNCGYGPGVSAQLCAACDPTGNSTVAACCYDSKTNLSQCSSFGHPGAAAVRATSSASPGFVSSTGAGASPTGGAAAAGANSSSTVGNTGLSGGALAGIIVGCVVGALLIGALLAFLIFGLAKKRKNKDPEASRGLVYGGAASKGEKGWNQSEEGTQRSIGDSPMGEKNHSPASGGHANLMAAGAGGAAAGGLGAAALAGSSQSNSPENRPDSQLSSGTGGSDGRGTTVNQVKDQYTGQDIFPGEEVIAIYPYNASLNDELTLEPDQKVKVVRLYDDGWALGRTADGQEGALPLVCISSMKGDLPGRGPGTGTGTSEDGMTSGGEYYTSSVEGAVTADEGGFTSDATGMSRRR